MDSVLINRLCRGGCTLLAVSLSGQVLAQQAYFSVEGEITSALGTHEMYFQTTRTLTTSDDVQFITFASSGGTNAAGDDIPGTGQTIDSLLELFSFDAGLSASNDDGAFGPGTTLDALLSWPGVAESGGTLPSTGLPTADDYRLTFSDLGDNNVGAWAVDLIGPADALQLTQLTPDAANPGGVSRLDSLKFGTNGAGANAATFDYIGLTDLEIAGPLVVANTGNGVLNLAQGEITVGGPTTINSGGTINITGGTLDADDDILIDGGTIDFTSGTLNLADGKTITARNNAQFTHAPGTSFNRNTSLIVESGADVTYQSFFGLGHSTGQDGTITVTGSGSTFTVSSGFNSFWGNTGGTATLNVLDNASAYIALGGGVTLASSGDSNSFGDINVESGGDLTFTRLDLATGSAASGEVTVTGSGSTFTQTGISTLTVGGTGTGTATIDVNDSAVFTSGTGDITINPSGTVTVNTDGIFNANGNVTVDGGTIQSQANGFRLASGKTLTASNDAQVTLNGGNNGIFHLFNGNRELLVESGADLSFSNPVSIGIFSASNGTVTVDGSGSTLAINADAVNGVSDVGAYGASGDLTVRNNAEATIHSGSLQVASTGGTSPSTSGTINVESGGSFTVNNLRITHFDTNTGTGTVNVTGAGSAITQTGASQLIVGNAVAGTAELNTSNAGTFNSGTGDITIKKTGTLNINSSGTFNANGDIIVDGGTLSRDGGNFNLASGKNLTASNDGQVSFASDYAIGNGSTFTIQSGADLVSDNYIDVGYADDGTLIVDGPGSTLSTDDSSSYWGANGGNGNVTLRNQATATLNGPTLQIGQSGADNTTGTANIESNADLTANAIYIGRDGSLGGFATLTVTGSGSTVTQNGTSELTLGHASNGTATLNVNDSATFTTGTGNAAINKTGTLDINTGGTFNANGDITIDGGTLKRADASTFNLAANKTLIASNGALVEFKGFFGSNNINHGTTFTINSGADLKADVLSVGDGSAGTLTVDGAGSTLEFTTSSTSYFGDTGGDATVTISNGATANGGSNWYMRNGTFTVDGTGSSVEQGASALLSVGSNSGGSFQLNVQNNAAYTTGQDYTEVIDNGTINVGSDATFTVKGLLRLYDGGTANVSGGTLNANQSISLNVNSTLNLSAGTLTTYTIHHTSGGTFNFTGGTLHVGAFNGTLTQDGGALAPGSSAGLTTIDGDYGFNTGTLDIEIGGITQDTEYDHVHVTGFTQLYGDLNVSLINGFTTLPGDSYTILSADGGIIDAFNLLNLPDISASNQAWQITNTGSAIVLDVYSTLAGDLNNDGFVGLDDLDIVLGNWNTNVATGAWAEGDPSGDGFVGLDDLDIVLNNWNAGTPIVNNITTIPEPAGLILLGSGAWLLIRRS